MPFKDARGAVIEIIEKRKPPIDDDSPYGSTVVPNEIRINGNVLLASSDHPIKLHEVEFEDGHGTNVVLVTLTLFARRVLVDIEEEKETRA